MGCKRYEILLVDMQGRAKQKRDWTEAQLLGSVLWMKRMNARGHNVLIRPAGKHSLILLDRLTQTDVTKLESIAAPCSAKVQVDEERFQIWLRLRNTGASSILCEGMTNALGLPKSDAGKFGSLAGFVMHHQAERTGGGSSFVLAHQTFKSRASAVTTWERVLEKVEELLKNQEHDHSHRDSKGISR